MILKYLDRTCIIRFWTFWGQNYTLFRFRHLGVRSSTEYLLVIRRWRRGEARRRWRRRRGGSLPFVSNQNGLSITFIICPKVDDFLWWGGALGGDVYGGKMDFSWVYGPEITDMMDIWVEKGTKR